jgi:oligosaccharide 4-alpha-D-glucosyltransferase
MRKFSIPKRMLLALTGLILALLPSAAQEHYLSHDYSNQTLALASSEAVYLISFASENTLRVVYSPGTAIPSLESYSVVDYPMFEGSFEQTETSIQLATDEFTVRITKDPLVFEFLDESGVPIVVENDGFTHGNWGTRISLGVGEEEAFWGAGSRAIPGNRRGYELSFFNRAEWGYDFPEEELNITIPFIVSSSGYGLYFDEHHLSDINLDSQSENQVSFTTTNDQLALYLITGDTNDEILKEFSDLTGYQPIPPKWVLGYIQSKYGYENETEARGVVSGLIDNDFPVDGLVLDLQWMGGHWFMGNMDWDRDRFPNAEAMLQDFREVGVKTINIFEPYVTTRSDNYNVAAFEELFAKNSIGTPYMFLEFWAGNASIFDITKPETLDWWWDVYDARLQEGVVGLWNDLGEPETHSSDVIYENSDAMSIHNVYSLLWAKMLHERFAENYPERRLFNLIRSGYAGMQRYRTFPWSGDIRRSYTGMAVQIPIIAGMSMSGVPYMHCDIGGFAAGPKDPELYTRWMQIGTFFPVMRAHGTGIEMEPYNYPEPYMSHCREAIKLRYRMFPYNYTLAYLAATMGRPLVLPMAYFDPENSELIANDRQFYWGENVLVAAVLEADQTSVTVSFPSGKWVNPVTLQIHEAYSEAEVEAPIDRIPYFIRSGSFFPMTQDLQNTDVFENDYYHIQFYVDPDSANASYSIYEDDGVTEGSLTNETFRLISLTGQIESSLLTVSVALEGTTYPGEPETRTLEFEIIGVESTNQTFQFTGQTIRVFGDRATYNRVSRGAFYDTDRKSFWLKFNWDGTEISLPVLTLVQPQN